MPNRSAPPAGSRYSGLWRDQVNNTIELYHNGTLLASYSASTPNAITGAISATTTITAGTGITATTGNVTATAGDVRVTAGNVRCGAVSAFATTEPTSAIVFKSGTAFAGAITTSGGLQSTDTVVTKIIANGTVSNVET